MGIGCREIFLFAGVGGEVVKLEVFVMIKLDELPIAIADGRAGFPRGTVIVRIMPIQRALAGVIALELGDEALAVGVELGPRGEVGEFEHRGKEIHAHHRLVRHAAGLRDAGSADDGRLAHAAFVEPTLSGPQREIAAGAKPSALQSAEAAVVAEENDDGVLVELEFFEFAEQRTDAVVHCGDHRRQRGVVLSHAVGAFVFALRGGFAFE